jgi:transposase-like protein
VVPSAFRGFRFPHKVIMLAVRWYLRFGLSYRDVEELLAERGVAVDHVSIDRWVLRFMPLLIDAARPCRHGVGDRWHVDETFVGSPGNGERLPRRRPAWPDYRRVHLGPPRWPSGQEVLQTR